MGEDMEDGESQTQEVGSGVEIFFFIYYSRAVYTYDEGSGEEEGLLAGICGGDDIWKLVKFAKEPGRQRGP